VTRRQLTDEQWELVVPYLPIGEYGPYPERLREQFEGVIWRFRSGAQWREMPGEFGPWPTVYGRFRVWRDAGVFTALLEGLVSEAARQGKTDVSLVSVDSTTARAHHDAGRDAHRPGGYGRPGGSRRRAGASPAKGGGPQEQSGQGRGNAPGREQRRRVQRRRKLRLNEALLGRSRGGLTSKITSPQTGSVDRCRSS
jgi:transposase